MMTRTLLTCLIASGLAFSGGCACGPWLNAPLGPGTLRDPGGGYTSGPVIPGPVHEPAHDSSCCGSHDSSCSVPRSAPYGPLTWAFDLLLQGYHGNDGSEIWWGDWHGALPDPYDPCDRHGNYTGRAGATGGPSECASCDQGQSGHVHHVGATATAEPEVVAGRYAPRLISTTDRAVARSVPQRELPRQRPANQ